MALARSFSLEDAANQRVENLPPMLRQYLEYKTQYPECLLLFQVGDFYEAFFEDACTLASTLNVTLTSRDKNSPDPIPMAGVPIAVVDGYINRLVAAGLSVAVVSQVTTVNNGAITRQLERIVTPAINLSSHELGTTGAEYLAALALSNNLAGQPSEMVVAYSSVASAKIAVRNFQNLEVALNFLSALAPAELIIPNTIDSQKIDRRIQWVRRIENLLSKTVIKQRSITSLPAVSETNRLNKVSGFTLLAPLAKKAVRQLVQYVDEVTVSIDLPFAEVVADLDQHYLTMDATTRRNLELLCNNRDGNEVGSLFATINQTCTSSGARELREWLLKPLTNIIQINQRLDAVETLKNQNDLTNQLRQVLRPITDLERCAARCELAIILPVELAALRDSLLQAKQLLQILNQAPLANILDFSRLSQMLNVPEELAADLGKSLADQIPATNYRGRIFKIGFDEELDRLRNLKDSGAAWMMQLESRERERTGIASLKVRHNNVHGYFIEVTKANFSKVPDEYIRKQTTVNAERYFIAELKEMEQQLYSADDKLAEREQFLLQELINKLRKYTTILRKVHSGLAQLDVLTCLATLAVNLKLVRPEIDMSRDLEIKSGRHPVLMQVLGPRLIANSLTLNEQQYCALITGANMGGKSTYLRQAALLVIMGQMGSFVPAEAARFGIVDKLFARLGASDDLLEGESTFMVEMREAANIIGNASDRSLVLIDEIGRGTATTDGLAIAQAILEWIIVKSRSRTLFATHFHELTKLDQKFLAIKNLSVATVEEGDSFLFTHEIKDGPADRSYGLEVARLAGLPHNLIKRAKIILDAIVAQEPQQTGNRQLSLFEKADIAVNQLYVENDESAKIAADSVVNTKVNSVQQAVIVELSQLDLEQVTPLDALLALNRLQKKILAP